MHINNDYEIYETQQLIEQTESKRAKCEGTNHSLCKRGRERIRRRNEPIYYYHWHQHENNNNNSSPQTKPLYSEKIGGIARQKNC